MSFKTAGLIADLCVAVGEFTFLSRPSILLIFVDGTILPFPDHSGLPTWSSYAHPPSYFTVTLSALFLDSNLTVYSNMQIPKVKVPLVVREAQGESYPTLEDALAEFKRRYDNELFVKSPPGSIEMRRFYPGCAPLQELFQSGVSTRTTGQKDNLKQASRSGAIISHIQKLFLDSTRTKSALFHETVSSCFMDAPDDVLHLLIMFPVLLQDPQTGA